MEFIVIILAIVVVIFGFMLIKAIQGTRYWNKCEKQYALSRMLNLSHEEALLEISKERHPELSSDSHNAIVYKFNDVTPLVLFLRQVLPGRTLGDEVALQWVSNTTIQNRKITVSSIPRKE